MFKTYVADVGRFHLVDGSPSFTREVEGISFDRDVDIGRVDNRAYLFGLRLPRKTHRERRLTKEQDPDGMPVYDAAHSKLIIPEYSSNSPASRFVSKEHGKLVHRGHDLAYQHESDFGTVIWAPDKDAVQLSEPDEEIRLDFGNLAGAKAYLLLGSLPWGIDLKEKFPQPAYYVAVRRKPI